MRESKEKIQATYLDRAIDFIDFLIGLMIQLELRFSGQLDAERLRRAVALAIDAEPILGYRLVPHWHRPYFQRMSGDLPDTLSVTEEAAEFDAFRGELTDPCQGPQLKVRLYHSAEGDRLLIQVTHNVTDVGGLNGIARTLSSIYSRLKVEPTYQPIPNPSVSRGLRQVTRQFRWYDYPRIFSNYIRGLGAQMPRQGTHTVLLTEGQLEAPEFAHRMIPTRQVSGLIEYGRSHDATLNDVMTAAVFRTLAATGEWNRQSHLRLNTSVDLRRWYLSGEREETIANLSAMEVLSLEDDPGDSFLDTLKRVSAIMRRRKSDWIGLSDVVGGLPILLLPDAWGRRLYRGVVQCAVSKNNIAPGLTNMGEIPADAVTFDSPPDSAWLLPPPHHPPYFLIGLSGYDGTLSLSSGVHPSDKNTVTQFLGSVVSQLPA